MSHEEAGCRMGVSIATFGRIVQRARKIIADALINGKAINIESSKEGVGKTSVSVNLSIALAGKGYKVRIMDVDLHGPDVPRMLGLEGMLTLNQNQKLTPMSFSENLQAVSVKSLTQNKDDAIIWRGPIKHSAKGNSSKEN
ncbi:MAG: P-loop NTPase [Deltaproteobacteria bacterium]|jgi:Mrp family chromosome partitioning ATPase|nr:P-loop NTPase [Deltaproteobacteria bacterium]